MPYSTKKTNRGSLLIYIHRGETDRLVSAIRHVISKVCKKNGFEKQKKWAQQLFINETHCILDETDVVDVISRKRDEIAFSGNRLLTCNTYKILKENNPLSYFDDDDDDDDSQSIVSGGGVIFMDYSQVDKLQRVLEKYHCPGMLPSSFEESSGGGAIHGNTAESKKIQVLLRRRDDPNNGELSFVNLNDWLDEKRMILEWTLELKGVGGRRHHQKLLVKLQLDILRKNCISVLMKL